MVGAREDPVQGRVWDVCTQYHALPDPERLRGLSWAYPTLAEAGTPMRVKVLYLSGGGGPEVVKLEMSRAYREIQGCLPACTVEMGFGELPFIQEVNEFGSYFDPATFATRNQNQKNKLIKKDLITSVRTTLRSIERFSPTFIVGDGPGAIIALAISRPEFLEEVLQYGNVQQVEIEKMAPIWSQILMIVCRRPNITKASLDVDQLERLFPTLFKQGDVEPDIPAVGVYKSEAVNAGVPLRDKITQFFDRAGLPKHSDISRIDWKAATSLPRRPYWGHQGQCACGKRV